MRSLVNTLRRRQLIGFGLAAAVTLASPISARADQEGTLVGRVLDEGGTPVSGAQVVVSSALLPDGEVPLVADGTGAFRLDSLESGFYDVSVEIDGIRRGQYRDVQVKAGAPTIVEVVLEPRVTGEGGY